MKNVKNTTATTTETVETKISRKEKLANASKAIAVKCGHGADKATYGVGFGIGAAVSVIAPVRVEKLVEGVQRGAEWGKAKRAKKVDQPEVVVTESTVPAQ